MSFGFSTGDILCFASTIVQVRKAFKESALIESGAGSATENHETLNFLMYLSDSSFAKGNTEFDSYEGSSTAFPRISFCDKGASSEISSMKANAETIPDDDSSIMGLTVESTVFNPSEKSGLIAGNGEWIERIDGVMLLPWRMEAVNLADLEHLELQGPICEATYAKPEFMSRVSKSRSPLKIRLKNPEPNCVSVADSSESVPPLTEGYSGDSGSTIISEPSLIRDEFPENDPFCAITVCEFLFPTEFVSVDHSTCFKDMATSAAQHLEKVILAPASSKCPLPSETAPLDDNSTYEGKEMVEFDSSVYSDTGSSDSDSGSVWMSDYSESIPILKEGHPFLLIKHTVLQVALDLFRIQQLCGQGCSSNQATKDYPASNGTERPSISSEKKRRRGNRIDNENSLESGDDNDSSRKKPRTSKKEAGHQVSFACPFAKKDPRKHRRCYAYVLKRIRDVKQHLSRFHQLPIYCPRCMSTFDTEDERDEHIRASNCPVRDAIAYEGVTRAQKAQLAQRVSSNMALQDQWFAIFEILFPGHQPRPRSAFVNADLTVDLESFQDLMYAEGPGLIAEAISLSGIQLDATENEERDLSALLQSAIEEGLHTIAQRWSITWLSGYIEPIIPVERSATSSSSRTVEGSRPSQPSQLNSTTLINRFLDTRGSEQTHIFDDDEPENIEDRPDGSRIQRPSLGQDMEPPPFNHDGHFNVQSDVANFESSNNETLEEAISQDDQEWWRGINYNNHFPWDDNEDPNAST